MTNYDLDPGDMIDEALATVAYGQCSCSNCTPEEQCSCPCCTPDERASLTAAAHYAMVNLTSMSADSSSKMSSRQLRRSIRRQTMSDLRCGGFISAFAWLLKPLFMWAIRVMVDRLVDRFFQGK